MYPVLLQIRVAHELNDLNDVTRSFHPAGMLETYQSTSAFVSHPADAVNVNEEPP